MGLPGGARVPIGPGVGDWIALVSLPGHVDGAFVAGDEAGGALRGYPVVEGMRFGPEVLS